MFLFIMFLASCLAEEPATANGCEIYDTQHRFCLFPEHDCAADPVLPGHVAFCTEFSRRLRLLDVLTKAKPGARLVMHYSRLNEDFRSYARISLGCFGNCREPNVPEILGRLDAGLLSGQEGRFYAAHLVAFEEAIERAMAMQKA